MDTFSLIQGLRFVDSFFPSGGFAFSSGLEAAVKDGAIRDGKEFARYVEDLLLHGIGKREAIAVAVAHQAASTGKLESGLTVSAFRARYPGQGSPHAERFAAALRSAGLPA